ncbi:MAG: beta-ketoacyl-ACP synthase [Hyphomicrobiaceae bacterium]|nr:beta-ketoacyl-ACP synthase [Hyphomicrobiaceae bacterium]
MTKAREVWITGIGIVSCAGEGKDAHNPHTLHESCRYDTTRFQPYCVHPLCKLDFSKQIVKVSEQRQMGVWQCIGVYAAGLALADAGLTGHPDVLDRTHLIVAAGNGERDCAFDSKVLQCGVVDMGSAGQLNEALMTGLRPTLYLGELSNLLAGNISITHHVTGSSRTFKGEEIAGVSALENAFRRIIAGQGEVVLVGGALNAEREDLLLGYELGRNLWPHDYRPVWSRKTAGGGFIPGSVGAFLLLESREHAEARGRKPYARVRGAVTDRCRRKSGETLATLRGLFSELGAEPGELAVLSGASGVEPATSDELEFLQGLEDQGYQVAVRAYGSLIGHSVEAHFPAGICLAALALADGELFAPSDENWVETPFEGAPTRVLVTGVGHWRGEGLALLEKVA